jgi:hypothetical protein
LLLKPQSGTEPELGLGESLDRLTPATDVPGKYLVLRFLAEDAGKHLDLVLDTILAGLVH